MKNKLSLRNFYFFVLYINISTLLITGVNGKLHQDSWIPLLLATVPASVLMLLYGRMIQLSPGKNLFDMAYGAFGNIGGKLFHILFAVYAVHLLGLVLNITAGFAKEIALQKTPLLVIMAVILLPSLYIARSGARTLGTISFLLMLLSLCIIVFNTVMSAQTIHPDNYLPLFTHTAGEYLLQAIRYVSYPCGDTVLLLVLADGLDLKKEDAKKPYQCLVFGCITGCLYLCLVLLRAIGILGPFFTQDITYFIFKAVSVPKIGTFLQRTESLTGAVLILFGILKAAVCIFAAARALSAGLRRKGGDTVDFTAPAALLGLSIAPLLFKNSHQIVDFVDIYASWYAPIFQILLPMAIWAVLEIRTAAKRRSGRAARERTAS